MTEIISVRFKSGGKQYFFDPQGEEIKENEGVIVETARGNEYGTCILTNHKREQVPQPLRKVIRIATANDLELVKKNHEKEDWAYKICIEKIAEHKLEMKLVSVEYSFEGNKVLFFFTADGRVDFRGLVRDLASTIHARIELRQIGVRDEAKMIGGLGICGRPFCCNQFLDKFQPVSIKMAKTQSLSLNPAKISGTCGRLMCCLKYEQDAYEHLQKTTPQNDSFVETPDGAGNIIAVNLLRQKVSVRLESDPASPRKYHNSEIVVVRSGRGRRPEGYVQPPLAKLEKQRRVVEEIAKDQSVSLNPLASALEAMLNPPPAPKNKKEKNQSNHNGQNQNNRNQNGNRYNNQNKQKKQSKDGGKPPHKRNSRPQGNRPPNKNQKRQNNKNFLHQQEE